MLKIFRTNEVKLYNFFQGVNDMISLYSSVLQLFFYSYFHNIDAKWFFDSILQKKLNPSSFSWVFVSDGLKKIRVNRVDKPYKYQALKVTPLGAV